MHYEARLWWFSQIKIYRKSPAEINARLGLTTGMRPKELVGLRPERLKLVEQEIEGKMIRRGVAEVRQIAVFVRGRGWQMLAPKTPKSVRDIPFPARLYNDLMDYRLEIERRKRLMGRSWNPLGILFPDDSGNPVPPVTLRQTRLKRVLRRTGLPLHFTTYSLRYSYATLQMLGGERDKVIADLMGHTDVTLIKKVYQQVLPVMTEGASDRMEKLLFGDVRTALAQSEAEHVM